MNFRVAGLSLLVFVVVFALVVVSAFSATNTSTPNYQFNVTPNLVYLNWTNSFQSNITLALNNSSVLSGINVALTISNTTFNANYSQTSGTCNTVRLLTELSNGTYLSTTEILKSNASNNSTTVTLLASYPVGSSCAPGKYSFNNLLNITNGTSESTSIDALLNLPIISSTTLNSATGVGTFNGVIPANATTYQSFYFYINNASAIQNATAVTVSISWTNPSQSLNAFLFNGAGSLQTKAVARSTSSETMQFNYLPNLFDVWEIRVYGNSTTQIPYTGTLYFSTLNATNSSGQTPPQINLGTLTPSQTVATNLTLTDMFPLNLSTIKNGSDLYFTKTFNGNGTNNYTLLVPDSSTILAVNASLKWSGGANYSLYVINTSGSIAGSSVNQHIYANVSNATEEEYASSSPPSSSGVWTFEVLNSTSVADNYNLTIRFEYNTQNWITTNYTSTNFNSTNSVGIQVNLTVQNNTLDGSYQGTLYYEDSNQNGLAIPIVFNVSTPSLVANQSYSNQIIRIDEDYGTTLNRTLNIFVNNTGTTNMTLNMTQNSTILTCNTGITSSCSGYFANLTYNTTNNVSANGVALIQITEGFNSSMPTGLYNGWILFDASNNTSIANDSHPYDKINLTLQLNLTNLLTMKISGITTPAGSGQPFGNSSASGGYISLRVDLSYINGTSIVNNSLIAPSNFTSIWISEGNVTNSLGDQSGNFTLTNYTDSTNVTLWCNGTPRTCPDNDVSGHYYINATISPNTPGGIYFVNALLSLTGNSSTAFNGAFTATASNQSLVVNNTGLYMRTNTSTSISLSSSSSSQNFYVNVSNFGPIPATSATTNISMSTSCSSGWTISAVAPTSATCSVATQSGLGFTLSNSQYSTNCILIWSISNSSSTGGACSANITGVPSGSWFNNLALSFSAYNFTSASSSTTTTTTTTTSSPTYLSVISYPSTVLVTQGSSNSTTATIKNTNNTLIQSTTVSITGINASWVNVATGAQSIAAGAQVPYTITFTVPSDANVTDYSGTLQAQSSYATVTQLFTLRVLPSNTSQLAINLTFTQILANYTQIWQLYNQSMAAGANLTAVDPLFSALQTQIQQAQSDIALGTPVGYFQAQQLFSNIESLISATQEALVKAQPPGPDYLLYGIIIAAVIGGLVVLYMFLPSKSPLTKKENAS